MHHQDGRALRPALGAGVGLLLTSGLLAACATSPASGPAGATTARTAASGHVYVTNQLDDTLSVINGQTNKVTATVPAGKAPEGVAAAPDHRHVYIADKRIRPGIGAQFPNQQGRRHRPSGEAPHRCRPEP